jgi:Tol biopolymer transport system component
VVYHIYRQICCDAFVRIIQRVTCVLVLACVSLGGSVSLVGAAPAQSVQALLPVLSLVFDSDRTGNFEIFTMRTDGSTVRQLTRNAAFDSWWGRLSPDRQHILFYRAPRGVHDTDAHQNTLWLMNADGTNQHQLLAVGAYGWGQHGHAEWSPDGKRLVMQGGSFDNPQIFVTDSQGKLPTQLTNRAGTNVDPSWSADGSLLVFAGCPLAACSSADLEIYAVSALGGTPQRLTADTLEDHDPYFSPDGTRIAWLRQNLPNAYGAGIGAWNIFVGGGSTPTRNVTNDGNINSKPQWSHDGSLLYFHRYVIAGSGRWNLFSIRPDGTALTELSPGAPGNNEYPSI